MKDDKLEKEFEEYFKGVNTPDNITGDAKKYVRTEKKSYAEIFESSLRLRQAFCWCLHFRSP